MKTIHNEEQLKWHLENNAFGLSPKAVAGVLNEVRQFNAGEKTTASFIDNSPDQFEDGDDFLTLGEMFDDLKINITD